MKTHLFNTLTAIFLLIIPILNFAQAPPLGTAANFVLFTTVGAVGNTGISQITGNVGTNSGAITGFGNVNGVMHTSDGATAQCAADLLIAYNQLNSTVPTFFPANLLGNGQILNAGVYSISGAATLNLGLSLDAQGNPNAVFIFKIQGTFSTNASSKVYLINGALACNVFWKVEGLVSMAAGTTMRGTVIANNAAINMNVGDTLEGRALSTTGAVNVNGVLAYTPIGCGSPVLMGPTPPALASTQCYALFSSNGPVSNAGITYVTGDIGTNVGLTTGFNPLFVTGTIHPIPDASTAQAAADLGNVYTYLNTLSTDIELLYPAQFGNNLVLTPHTYLLNAATVFTGNLYLNAQGNANAVFAIKINGALTTSTYSKVLLINGALAKNVYWKVDGAVSINDYSDFKGTIVCNNGAVLLTTGVTIDGRAFTTTGALSTSAITAIMPPGCGGTSSPSITAQPTDQTACVGSSASFSVTATGTGLTYQWRTGIVNLINGGNISGATSSTLTINPVNISDAASNYNVVVSGTFNPSVTSINVSLVVNPLPVPTITGPTPVCVTSIGNVYITQSSMLNYIWTVSAGGAITSGGISTSNVVVVAWNTAGAQTVSVNYTNGNGCTAAAPTVYNVTVNPLPTPTITGPASVCFNSTGNVYTTQATMTGYIWTVSAGGAITAGSGTNAITVTWNTVGPQTVCVNYTNSNGCTAVAPTCYTVTVNPRPAPVIAGPNSVCAGSCGNVYTTESGMTGYVWTISAGGSITAGAGTNAITVCWNTAGAQSVTVNYNNSFGCPATTPTVFAVTVNPLPVPTITGPVSVCVGSTGNIYTTQAGMTGYAWTVTGGTITGGAGTNAITVTWNASGAQTFSVVYTNANGCTNTTPAVFNVTVNPPPVPTITGYTSMCINVSPLSYFTETGMTGYLWTVSAGNVIVSGQGTNQVQISWNVPGAQWVAVTYTNPQGCSAVVPTQLNVFVNPLPGPAGAITGTAAVCGGTNGVAYSVGVIANTTTYVWTLPAGVTIATGAGTNSITVNFDPFASSGDITVWGNNICGNGITSPPFAVTVTPLPYTAGVITGQSAVCQGVSGVIYSVATIANASGYVWTVPAGATIVAGTNTNSITVDFSLTAISGIIVVYGTNSCGNGAASPSFAVMVNPIPATPVVTVNGDILNSNAPAGNQWYFEGDLIPGATGQTYQAIQSGWYWTIVNLNGCNSDTSNHVYVVMVGQQELQTSEISIYPVPNDGRFTVSIVSPSQEPFTINVFTNLGIKIHEVKNIHVNGRFDKVIDLRPVLSGLYTVVIWNSSNHIVKKVIVSR